MNILHRKSRWERMADRATSTIGPATPAIRKGVTAAAGAAAVAVASATISSIRRKGDR
jgi:hypothetical protein